MLSACINITNMLLLLLLQAVQLAAAVQHMVEQQGSAGA
jgi:hypothetical protein